MDENNSESKTSILELDDFDEENKKIFPHHTGFPKDLFNHSNNFFNAAFHCLTNIYDLTSQIIDIVEKKYPYIKLLNKIIVMNKEKKEEHKEELKYCLENLKQYIIPIIDIENEKDGNDDPKKLILLILQDH